MPERRPIIITRWASQAGRSRAALAPDYVGIDERTLPDLLAFAPAFARHMRYVDTDNQPDGNWSDFFLTDGAMLRACMAVFDAAEHSRRFSDASRQVQLETSDTLKLERLQTLFNIILALIRDVDVWHVAAERLPDDAGADALRDLLTSTIGQDLAPLLARLRGYGVGAGQPGGIGHPLAVDCRHFQPIWQTEFVCPDSSIYQGHFRRQKINAALGPLASLYELLLGSVSDLTDRVRRDFPASFAHGRLKPHIALYAAFIQQFQVAQSRLNELPGRVVDFYYRDVLRERLRPPVPDQMFLTFTRAPGITPARVVRGTPFPAGADAEGRPILFLADQTLDIERALLVRARAIRTTRGPLHDGATRNASAQSSNRLHRVNVTNILVAPDAGSTDDKPWDGKPWTPFGTAAAGCAGTMTQPAPLGFAITSPALLLTGGQRSIKLSLCCPPQFGRAILAPLLQDIAEATGLAAAQALKQVVTEAFNLSVTTPTGWLDIASRDVTVSPDDPDGRIISFQLEMSAADPPLMPAAGPAPPGTPTDAVGVTPAVLARLRQDPVTLTGPVGTASVYPLALLEDWPIERVIIETGVTHLPGATIRTRGGPVDATAPFLPFGAPARANAWFQIQHRELFAKPLDRLTVSIDWLGVPAHPRGFAGYYEQYVVGPDRTLEFSGIANTSFRVAATLVGDAPWSLVEAAQPLYLFHTKDGRDPPEAAGALDTTTNIVFAAQPRTEAASRDPQDAALRITLTDPLFGFGDELYAPNVLHAVHSIQALPAPPRGRLCRLIDLLFSRPQPAPPVPPDMTALYPNPAWQPEIAGFSIGYHAIATLDVRDAQASAWLHLLPSGALAPATPDQNGGRLLLPRMPQRPQLDLGFAGLGAAQTLTILFRMTGNGRAGGNGGGLSWRALGADGWFDLTANAGCRDGSNGLRQSGIVALDLPPMASDAAERLSWIRAVPLGDPDSFPDIAAITPHALTATRTIATGTSALPAIAPKTVKAAATPLAGVATIDQPMASFGGRSAETSATLPIRLGERLRHKERASLAWDHERLVLERFPDIAKVRVLPARNAAGSPKPGDLLIVAVPSRDALPTTDPLMPRSDADTRGRIQASLQAASSPFVRVHVVDPLYVQVTVQADIVVRTDIPAQESNDGPTRLGDDLREFLSPGSSGLDLPHDTGPDEIRAALANFIATRSYIAGLVALDLRYEPPLDHFQWCVLTSAPSHDIRVARPGTASNKLKSGSGVVAIDDAAVVHDAQQPRLPSVPHWPSTPPS